MGLVIVQVERVCRERQLEPARREDPRSLGRLRRRRRSLSTIGRPSARQYSPALSGELRRVRSVGLAAGADRAQGHRAPGGHGAPAQQRGESRYRHARGRRQRGRRGAHPRLPHADRRARRDGRHADRGAGFRRGGERPRHPGSAVPVRFLRRRRLGRRVPRHGPSRRAGQCQRQPVRIEVGGLGGFINISQNAKRVVFLGTFVAPSRSPVQEGRLVIADGVAAPKFLADVEQRTFSGEYAAATGSRCCT